MGDTLKAGGYAVKLRRFLRIAGLGLLALVYVFLAILFIPETCTAPSPSPKLEAYTNLRILYVAEDIYKADNGRYAPVPDGDLSYQAGETGMQNTLRMVRLGPPDTLNYHYMVSSFENGKRFIAKAIGKKGTKVEGETFEIDQSGIGSWEGRKRSGRYH